MLKFRLTARYEDPETTDVETFGDVADTVAKKRVGAKSLRSMKCNLTALVHLVTEYRALLSAVKVR